MANRFWCDGKHKHKSEGAADAAIRSMVKRNLPDTDKMRAYRCVTCFSWHTGNLREAGKAVSV
jgi:hypothetical protein